MALADCTQTTAIDLPVAAGKLLRRKPSGVKLYQLNSEPLAERRPLILVHGLLAEKYPLFRWRKVVEHLRASEEFKQRYKVYLVRYDTYDGLDRLTEGLKGAISRLYSETGKPAAVISLSLGGNLVEASIQDTDVNKAVHKIIAMAAMFHGSPLFVTDWAYKTVMNNHITPWVRLDKLISYKAYFKKHKNLLEGLGWSNTDSMKPDSDRFQAGMLWPKFRVESVEKPKTETTKRIGAEKFTLYAGYLENDYVLGKQHGFLYSLLTSPLHFFKAAVPQHLGREHAVLVMLNKHLAEFPTESDIASGVRGRSYIYNDGISPVSSGLFIPAARVDGPTTDFELLSDRVMKTGIANARLFPRSDHLSFIDEFSQGRSKVLPDMLHMEEAPKRLFDWILSDLLVEG